VQEKIDAAVERVKSLMRQGYKAPYAIGIVANETGIDKTLIAKAMAARRWHPQSPTPPTPTPAPPEPQPKYLDASELCRECGYELERGEALCPLCGEDTSWIW
jgi:uncharacterized protein YoaH (UPF0181 family)